MFSGARTGAAKVESQRGDVGVFESARCAKDNLVVQSAASEWMRMADDGDAGGILQLAIERLESSGAAVEIDVPERLRIEIHDSLTRMRSPSTRTSCGA